MNEVYQSKNVILSGWSIKKCLQVKVNFSFEDQIKFYKELDVDISLKRELLEKANYIEKKYINDKTLGLFIRGTDYVALKPKGHYIQPTVEMLLSKVKEYIQEFQIDNIFLITEDKEIENKIKKSLNVSINVLSNNICDKYDGKDYLSSYFSKSEVIENAENYILRVILLARCKYLISSITSATLFMLSFENCMFQKSYFFDLGKY